MKKILYIGNKLQKANSNISYITILGELLENTGYTLRYASSYQNKLFRLFDMISTFYRMRNKVDVVLIDTYSTQNFYYALIISQLCKIFKLDYIPILHGGNLPSRLVSHPKMCQMVFSNAKHNVSPSLYLKSAFENYGYTNVIHIPNTFEIKNYPFNSRGCDVPKLLWVRSFSKIYNPKLAIEVFNSLKKIYPSAELCMVGPDSDGSLLEIEQLALKLNLDVKFTGKLSKQEWIELSKDYNMFLNTTNFDNTPLSVIEAMALGLPIISTNVGGMPYLIEHKFDGLLVAPNDSVDMKNAICYLMTHPNLVETIVQNARFKVEQFDWKKVKTSWISILEQDNS